MAATMITTMTRPTPFPATITGRKRWSRRASTPLRRAALKLRSPSGWPIGTGSGRNGGRARDRFVRFLSSRTCFGIHEHREGMYRKRHVHRSEEHTSELQSLMRISYAVFCLKKKHKHTHEASK